jgi:hypothetical protein
MKKLVVVALLITSCKTSSHKCDAYGSTEQENDIHKISLENQKKYSSVVTIKK